MSLDTEERPGFKYSSDDDSDTKPSGRGSSEGDFDLNKSWNGKGVNNDYNPNNPATKAKIANAEANPSTNDGAPKTTGLNGAENILSNGAKGVADKVGTGAMTVVPPAKIAVLMSRVNKKNAGIGGLIGAILATIFFMMFVGSTTYLVNLKENLVGESNRFSNTIGNRMERRRINSTLNILKSQAKKIEANKFVAKARAAGFETEVEKGVVKKISKDGSEIVLNSTEKSIKSQLDDIIEKPGGRLFLDSFDDISSELASRTVGKTTRGKVFKFLGIKGLTDWITPRALVADPEALDGGNRQLADAFVNSDATIKAELDNAANNTATRLSTEAAEAGDTATGVLTISDDLQREADEFAAKKAAANGQEVLIDNVDNTFVDAASSSGDNLAASLTEASTDRAAPELLDTTLAGLGPKVAGRITQGLAKSGDVTAIFREGCRVKGLLTFLRSVKNIMIAAELAKWAVQFLTIADSQKASLTSGTAIKVMSLYMKDATKSGGMQWQLTGGKAKVGAAGLTKYGTGSNDVGVLATISDFVNKVPGINNAKNCKIVNNPLTQVGGTIVGGAAAVLTGGASFGLSAGWSVGLTVANEIAFAVGKPMLIAAISGQVLSMHEGSPDNGNATASGIGGLLLNQSSAANGGLPVSTQTFAKYETEATYAYQQSLKEESVFDRYLNVNNPASLIARTSIQSPQDIQQVLVAGKDNFTSLSSSLGSITSVFIRPFSNKAFAEEQIFGECTDPWILELGVATDPFCNPIMAEVPLLDIDQTQKALLKGSYIDGTGEPIGEFKDFVENCFSGRTGVLHPVEIKDDGSTNTDDDTCVVGRNDKPLAGDVPEIFASPYMQDDRSFIAKTLSPKVFAAEPSTERIPTKKERFAAWYGYQVDQENLTSQINGQLVADDGEDPVETNANVVVIGDSLTVGMQTLNGTDTEGKNYLQRELNNKGWSATVDAQGCRAVYQTQGVIVGDGNGCPAETIIDGISAVSDPKNSAVMKSSGTFVIALGTNGYETDASGSKSTALFKAKSIELIDKIRQFNPSANIYWLNLRFLTETAYEIDRNEAINQIVNEKGIKLMDWDTYVNTVNSNSSTADDVTFGTYSNGTKDSVHHDANGYKAKTSFLVNALGPPPSNVNDTTVITGQATDNIPCTVGTDKGVVDGYEKGVLTKIRVCDVQGTVVNSQIAANVDKMFTEARIAGAPLGGAGFRTMDSQTSGWKDRCGSNYPVSSKWASPPCRGAQLARPGFSNHQMGFAIDLSCNGALIVSVSNPCFLWLEKNAARFGMYEWGNNEQLPVSEKRGVGGYEPWHWSINGS